MARSGRHAVVDVCAPLRVVRTGFVVGSIGAASRTGGPRDDVPPDAMKERGLRSLVTAPG